MGFGKRKGYRDRQEEKSEGASVTNFKWTPICGAPKSPYMAWEEILCKELHANRSSSNGKNMRPNGGACAVYVSPRAKQTPGSHKVSGLQATEDRGQKMLPLPPCSASCLPPPPTTHPEPDQHPSSLLLRSGRDSEIA